MILPLMTAAAEMASQSGVEGTLFALMMGIFNLSQIFWGMLGSKLLGPLGLNGLIALATLVQLAGYLVISPLSKISFSTGAVSQPGKVE